MEDRAGGMHEIWTSSRTYACAALPCSPLKAQVMETEPGTRCAQDCCCEHARNMAVIADAALGGHDNYDAVSSTPTRKLVDCCCEHARDMASSLMLLLVVMAIMRQ